MGVMAQWAAVAPCWSADQVPAYQMDRVAVAAVVVVPLAYPLDQVARPLPHHLAVASVAVAELALPAMVAGKAVG